MGPERVCATARAVCLGIHDALLDAWVVNNVWGGFHV
jgi:hypothetical protein